MFAVIESGGKQYIAQKGKVLFLEKLNAEAGEEVVINDIRLLSSGCGDFTYNSGKVVLELLEQKRSEKLVIFKKKRRKNMRKKTGHRQYVSVVRVKDIVLI